MDTYFYKIKNLNYENNFYQQTPYTLQTLFFSETRKNEYKYVLSLGRKDSDDDVMGLKLLFIKRWGKGLRN